MNQYEQYLFELFGRVTRYINTRPLNLGGYTSLAGGEGGPPGGFTGYLPQGRVAYDTTEAETMAVPASGSSIVDNLNRIRYRIAQLETSISGVIGDISIDSIWQELGDLAVGLGLSSATVLSVGNDGEYLSADSTAPTGLKWTTISGVSVSGSGDVTGPSSSVDGNFVSFSGTTGKVIQDSGYDYSDFSLSGHTHAQLHDSVTVVDSSTIDFSLTGQEVSGTVIASGIKLDDLGTPDDNTDLDASTDRHGLMQKYPGGTSTFLRADGTFASPPTTSGTGSGDFSGPDSSIDGNIVVFSGTSGKYGKDSGYTPTDFSLSGHTHAQLHDAATVLDTATIDFTLSGQQISGNVIASGIKLDDLGEPDNNTDLNASITRHGLLPILPNDADKFLNGVGQWVTISGVEGIGTSGGAKVYVDQSGGASDTYGVLSGDIDGENTEYTVSQSEYDSGSLTVYLNGQLLIQGSSEDWTETIPTSGTFSFTTAPEVSDEITAIYTVTTSGIMSTDSIWEAKGDLAVGIGDSQATILSVGTEGQVLTVSSGSETGLTWATTNNSNTGDTTFCNGRLTLESGVPISTTDQTSKTTLYYTPYIGNNIALYNGISWDIITFTEISIAIPATTSQMYDVFCYNNSDTATLELLAWTNDTTRATALVRQDGKLCKSGDLTRRYLGSIRTTTVSGKTEDSLTSRFVWNYYNRVNRLFYKKDETAHSYTTAARRAWNNDTTNLISVIVGVLEDTVNLTIYGYAIGPNYYDSGIGIDSFTSVISDAIRPAQGNLYVGIGASYNHYCPIGYHYYGITEWGGNGGYAVAVFMAGCVKG